MIVTIIGARPQFVKAAVLSKRLKEEGLKEEIIHTGQHYDYKMNEVFFNELGLPGALTNLNVGSGNHGAQTAEMLKGIEETLLSRNSEIDFVLLYGDTNSTLAGAMAAAKLNIPIVHVEAGLRSFNRTMPEEINRIVTDHLSSLLFCSSQTGKQLLKKEGIENGVHIVGDIMLDAITLFSEIARNKYMLKDIIPSKYIQNYNLLTIHRPANTDNKATLQNILDGMQAIGEPIVWPVHPRNKRQLEEMSVPENILLFEPFSYLEMLVVLEGANKVITDSGGLQKEAYWKKKPCITIRPETEWVETLHNNWNILSEPNSNEIYNAFQFEVDKKSWKKIYGDGDSAQKIVSILKADINKQ